jgi:GT2 family glycosyltransferase
MSESAGLTVILPTLDRSEYLRQTVVELLDQKYTPLEILIVDQSANPDREMIRDAGGNPLISYHHVNFRGLPEARNFGWKRAKYDAILFLDDDIHCYSGLLRTHAESLRGPGIGIVGGGIEEARAPDCFPAVRRIGQVGRFTGLPDRHFHARGQFDVEQIKGANFSTRRDILEAVNGFDEAFNVGAALYEEMDFCLRVKSLGFRITFRGDARIIHLGVPRGGCRVPVWDKYMFGMAHNRALVIRRHVRAGYRPIGLARLLITAVSLTLRKLDYRVMLAFVRGVRRGYQSATDGIQTGAQ